MANRDAPMGLSPTRHLTGGTIRMSEYRMASGYASNLYRGQLVDLTTTNRNIIAATDGGDVVGVFGGVQYVDSAGDVQFRGRWTASATVATGTVIRAYVWDDPNIIFRIQTDVDVDAVDIGQWAGVTNVGSGDNALERSICEINAGDISGSEDSFFLYQLFETPDNAYGANAEVEVLLGHHLLGTVMTAS